MAARARRKSSANRRESERASAAAGLLLAAAGVALLHLAWSLFQWNELADARSGGEVFCALGGGEACAHLWDSGFARGIESVTGLPVAGWGAVWSLAALALPLLAWRRVQGSGAQEPFWSGSVVTAAAGAASVVLLGGVSLAAGAVCTNCLITYVIVLAYGGVVMARARTVLPRRLGAGVPAAAAAVGVAFGLLLYPGLQTPGPIDEATAVLLDTAGESATPAPAYSARGLDPAAARLAERIERLPAQHKQLFSNARGMYLMQPRAGIRPPRGLAGSAMAPVRLTHFSDVLCSHCRRFHEELADVIEQLPPNSISVEYRKFPLHPSCNAYAHAESVRPVRCLAAKALICLEEHPDREALLERLFEHQHDLDEQMLYAFAEPLMPRARLEACSNAPETLAKLKVDVDWAAELAITGTPLVLLNGRVVPTYIPFIYAMGVLGGDAGSEVFANLPSPSVDGAALKEPTPYSAAN